MNGAARNSDPDTSKAAAETVYATRLESRVYWVIHKFGKKGCISDQIVNNFPDMRRHTVVPRLAKLLDYGFIEDTGERRAGETGRMQRVVRCTKKNTSGS